MCNYIILNSFPLLTESERLGEANVIRSFKVARRLGVTPPPRGGGVSSSEEEMGVGGEGTDPFSPSPLPFP